MRPVTDSDTNSASNAATQSQCRHAHVLRGFTRADGSLHTLPTKHAKWLVVLDHIVQSFELGQTYPEAAVNQTLEAFHPDFAALRRHLVDEAFMTREAGVYWRTGGSVDL